VLITETLAFLGTSLFTALNSSTEGHLEFTKLPCRYGQSHLHPIPTSCDTESYFSCPAEALESPAGPVRQSLSLPSVEAYIDVGRVRQLSMIKQNVKNVHEAKKKHDFDKHTPISAPPPTRSAFFRLLTTFPRPATRALTQQQSCPFLTFSLRYV
jgi:hypothetical protein